MRFQMPFFNRKHPDVACHVSLLDNSNFIVKCKGSENGGLILERVLQHLHVTEPDYFGLRFQQADTSWVWLSLKKSVYIQLKHSHSSRRFVTFGELAFTLYFGVKFYPSDPCRVENENCRFQVFLQTRRDLCSNRVRVPTDLRPLLCALCLQSDLGDYNLTLGSGYVKRSGDLPMLSGLAEEQAIEFAHRDLLGVTPAEAETQFLEQIKWMPSYGMTSFRVKDGRGVDCFLGVIPMGLVVERARSDSQREEIFWPRIHSISQKKTSLHVHVRAHERSETIYIFNVGNKNEAHALWKLCAEHQVFFRCERDSSFQPSILNQREREPRLPRNSRRRPTSMTDDFEFTVDLPHANNRLSAPDLRLQFPRGASSASKAMHNGYHSDTATSVMNSVPNSANSSWSDVTAVRQHVTLQQPNDDVMTQSALFPSTAASSSSYFSDSLAVNRNAFRQSAYSAFRQVSPSSSRGTMAASVSASSRTSSAQPDVASIPRALSPRKLEAHHASTAIEHRRQDHTSSHSPGRRPPRRELFEHIQFQQVNPQQIGLTEQEIRNIPFTKVETRDIPFRVRYSPNSGKARGRFTTQRSLPSTEILKHSSEAVSDTMFPSDATMFSSQNHKGYVSPSAPLYSNDLRAKVGDFYHSRVSASSASPSEHLRNQREKAFLASRSHPHDYLARNITTESVHVSRGYTQAQNATKTSCNAHSFQSSLSRTTDV